MANCTGLRDDSKLEKTIIDCCEMHDTDYVLQATTRKEADLKFYDCVDDKVDPVTAFLLFAAVSLGGWFFWYRRAIKNMIHYKSNKTGA